MLFRALFSASTRIAIWERERDQLTWMRDMLTQGRRRLGIYNYFNMNVWRAPNAATRVHTQRIGLWVGGDLKKSKWLLKELSKRVKSRLSTYTHTVGSRRFCFFDQSLWNQLSWRQSDLSLRTRHRLRSFLLCCMNEIRTFTNLSMVLKNNKHKHKPRCGIERRVFGHARVSVKIFFFLSFGTLSVVKWAYEAPCSPSDDEANALLFAPHSPFFTPHSPLGTMTTECIFQGGGRIRCLAWFFSFLDCLWDATNMHLVQDPRKNTHAPLAFLV